MKKRSQLIVILSALLCLAMLFASCKSDPDDTVTTDGPGTVAATEAETDATTKPETEPVTQPAEETTAEPETEPETEPTPDDLDIDYDAIISQWKNYINFDGGKADEEDMNTSLQQLLSYSTSDDVNTRVVVRGNLVFMTIDATHSDTEFNDELGYYEPVEYVDYTYVVYNMETGKQVLTASTEYKSYYNRNDDNEGRYAGAYEEFRVLTDATDAASYGIIIVETTDWEYVEAVIDESVETVKGQDPVIAEPAKWVETKTYSYYDQNGELIVADLPENDVEVVSSASSYNTIIRIGKVYVTSKNNNIISKLGENMKVEFVLDKYDVEYKGYRYQWNEDDGILTVLNTATHRITANWEYSEYRDSLFLDYQILGNGNVLFYYTDFYIDLANVECDFEVDGIGVRFIYVLLDIKTGETRELDLTHTIGETDYQYIIDSLVTNAGDDNLGMSLKSDDHQFAEIYLIKDGKLSEKPLSVILDNEMKVVATLDNFVIGQTAIDGVLENGDLVVYDGTYYYTVDVNGDRTEKVQKYYNLDNSDDVISGGFIYDGILYNDSMKPLVNVWEDYSDYEVYDKYVRAWSNEDGCYYYLSINSAGELVIDNEPEQGTYDDESSWNGYKIYRTYAGEDMFDGTLYTFAVYNGIGEKIGSFTGNRWTEQYGMLLVYNGDACTYYIIK